MANAQQVALITGASRGIGQAIALALGQAGFAVAGTATSATGADKISAYLQAQGITGKGFALNVAEADSVTAVVDAVGTELGTIAVLINNAGITRDNLLMRMKDAEWDAVINTNLSAVYRLSKACLRGMMKARWGRIVNISSVVGSMGNAGQANYAATKAGIDGFTRSLAAEVGRRGITVNAVAPGFIQTDMTETLPAGQKAALLEKIPAGRLGTPAEIAAVVAFLVSDGAAYITGETVQVNGGMYMA